MIRAQLQASDCTIPNLNSMVQVVVTPGRSTIMANTLA